MNAQEIILFPAKSGDEVLTNTEVILKTKLERIVSKDEASLIDTHKWNF
jgi:hypothetical protein